VTAAVPYWRLSSFYACYFALLGAWMPFWPLYLQQLGYGAAAIGLVGSVMQGTKIFAPSVWGWLAQRSGQRMRVIRWGGGAALLIFGLIFVRQDLAWLFCVVAGFSFFWNAVLAQFEVVTLGHLGSDHNRYSLIRVWGSVGFISIVTGLGFAFEHIDLRWLPWVMAALLAGIWLSTLSVGERRSGQQLAVAPGQPWSQRLRQPPVIAFFATCFLLQMAHGPYYTFFSVFLEQHGYSRSATGLLWSLGVLAEVGLFLLMHRLLLRFDLRLLLIGSLLASVVRWLLTAWLVDSLPWLIAAQCLHAATFASYHACAVELVRRMFAGARQGQGMALYSGVSYGGGGAAGAAVSGLVWAWSPAGTFVMASLLSLLAVFIAWRWLRVEPPP
jgi:PPP family 3-phenylpropionic acid transporter